MPGMGDMGGMMGGGGSDMGGAVGGAIGNVIGWFGGSDDRDQAGKDYQDAMNYWRTDARNPAEAHSANANLSGYNYIKSDPSTRNAQMQALGQMQQIYKSGGMDPQYKAQIAQSTNAANSNAQALNAGAQNNAAARGMGSSGQALAAARSNGQAAANQASNEDMQAAAGAQARQMAAIQGTGSMAGQVRGQDYSQASDKAAANDAIGRFNAQNQNNTNIANMQSANQYRIGVGNGMNTAAKQQADWDQGLSDKYQQLGYSTGSTAGSLIGSMI